MTAIADVSTLLNLLTGGGAVPPQFIPTFKVPRVGAAAAVATVANRWTSLWQYEGSPSAGAAPGSPGGNPDNTTTGGLRQTDATGGRQLWLVGMNAGGSAPGTLMIYDRLSHRSGLSGTSAVAQTVSLTPGRYTTSTTSIGNQIWLEIYTAVGATATTVTASYTNQAGTSGRTTPAVAFGGAGNQEAQRMIRLPLQSGDTGVTAVANVTLAASTTTAGDFGVTIVRPWAKVPFVNGFAQLRDFIAGFPNVVEVLTDACIAFAWFAGNTTAPEIDNHIVIVEN
jgi:hypothetical protein